MVQERFRAYVFRGPPPGPALAFCSERLASTPGGREHGIGVVGIPVRCCAGRGAHAGRKSHGRGLCITNGKASCRLVRFVFGRCWGRLVWGPGLISYRECEVC